MRYLIAMICGIAVALLVTMLASPLVADWVVAQHTFDSPDTVSDLHTFTYMATNLVGLVIGWTIGWWLGARFDKPADTT